MTEISLHQQLRAILDLIYQAREMIGGIDAALLSTGVSASELYYLTQELLEMILFVVKQPHFHEPRKNPKLMVLRDVVDEIGNSDTFIKVKDRRELQASDPVEIQAVEFLLRNIVSLRRNRRPARSISVPKEPSAPSPRKKKKPKASKKDQKDRRKRRWYYES